MKTLLTSLLLAFALAAPAFASGTATVFVVHGISGSDLGLARALPVDVSVNGACALKKFKFGDIEGPLSLPAGKISVAISLADGANPCGGAVAIGPANITLKEGETVSIVAYLNADGQPSARKFNLDASATPGARSRVTVVHTAAAPGVDVTIAPKIQLNQFRNADKFAFETGSGSAQVSIAPAGSGTPVFGPIALDLESNTRYVVFAVGSVANNTFTLLLKTY